MRRRGFLEIAGTAGACGVLASCAKQRSPWRFFTPAEARALEAICEQVIPADDSPGAAWAGVVNYIDTQLMGPLRKSRTAYRTGLAQIDQDCTREFGKGFADLDPARQQQFLAALKGDSKRFFSQVIAHTMQGYYGDPRHGGNREAVSWRMLGVPVIPIRGRNRYEFPKQGA